jgi:hypothetical protein
MLRDHRATHEAPERPTVKTALMTTTDIAQRQSYCDFQSAGLGKRAAGSMSSGIPKGYPHRACAMG